MPQIAACTGFSQEVLASARPSVAIWRLMRLRWIVWNEPYQKPAAALQTLKQPIVRFRVQRRDVLSVFMLAINARRVRSKRHAQFSDTEIRMSTIRGGFKRGQLVPLER